MSKVTVYPFTKFSWRNKSVEQKWEPLRRRIYTAVHFAEYEMVKRGHRHCDVYDFGPSNIMQRLRKVASDGLIFIPILISKTYGGYGHKHYVHDKFENGTFIYGGVARNTHDALLFHDAGVVNLNERIFKDKEFRIDGEVFELNQNGIDHNITGALLGYPKCDREFFETTWLKDGCVDPMYEMALNTEDATITEKNTVCVSGNPKLNRLARYWSYNIIPHFPHSFDCKAAGEFADKFYDLMCERDREATEACLEILKMPMVWSMNNCITTLEHPLFFGSANGYYRPEKVTVKWFPP